MHILKRKYRNLSEGPHIALRLLPEWSELTSFMSPCEEWGRKKIRMGGKGRGGKGQQSLSMD